MAMAKPITRTERLLWWLNRWFWWTCNGSFHRRAVKMMSDRTEVLPANGFIKATEEE